MNYIHICGKSMVSACSCKPECDFPCWQRVGIAPACEKCGCGIDTLAATVREHHAPVEIRVEAPAGSIVRLPVAVEVRRIRSRRRKLEGPR